MLQNQDQRYGTNPEGSTATTVNNRTADYTSRVSSQPGEYPTTTAGSNLQSQQSFGYRSSYRNNEDNLQQSEETPSTYSTSSEMGGGYRFNQYGAASNPSNSYNTTGGYGTNVTNTGTPATGSLNSSTGYSAGTTSATGFQATGGYGSTASGMNPVGGYGSSTGASNRQTMSYGTNDNTGYGYTSSQQAQQGYPAARESSGSVGSVNLTQVGLSNFSQQVTSAYQQLQKVQQELAQTQNQIEVQAQAQIRQLKQLQQQIENAGNEIQRIELASRSSGTSSYPMA